jgi:hypothetical protein
MTTNEAVDAALVLTTVIEGAYTSLKRAFDSLPEEQVYKQPTAETNSIAWLAWHMNRWKDKQSGQAVGEDEVWVTGGWHDKFGMTEDRTGMGDTPEQVAEFKPSLEVLWGYVDAVHEAFLARIAGMNTEDLEKPVYYIPGRGSPRPAWRSLAGICSDSLKHMGQIEYLKGLFSGKGSFPA